MNLLSIHHVTSIKLDSHSQLNGNCRTLSIKTKNGTFDITFFGETDALDAIEKSAGYHEWTPDPRETIAAE